MSINSIFSASFNESQPNNSLNVKYLIASFNPQNHNELDGFILECSFLRTTDQELFELFNLVVNEALLFPDKKEYLSLILYIQKSIYDVWFSTPTLKKDYDQYVQSPYYSKLLHQIHSWNIQEITDHLVDDKCLANLLEFVELVGQNSESDKMSALHSLELIFQSHVKNLSSTMASFGDRYQFFKKIGSDRNTLLLQKLEFKQLSTKLFNLILVHFKHLEEAVDCLYALDPSQRTTISQAYKELYLTKKINSCLRKSLEVGNKLPDNVRSETLNQQVNIEAIQQLIDNNKSYGSDPAYYKHLEEVIKSLHSQDRDFIISSLQHKITAEPIPEKLSDITAWNCEHALDLIRNLAGFSNPIVVKALYERYCALFHITKCYADKIVTSLHCYEQALAILRITNLRDFGLKGVADNLLKAIELSERAGQNICSETLIGIEPLNIKFLKNRLDRLPMLMSSYLHLVGPFTYKIIKRMREPIWKGRKERETHLHTLKEIFSPFKEPKQQQILYKIQSELNLSPISAPVSVPNPAAAFFQDILLSNSRFSKLQANPSLIQGTEEEVSFLESYNTPYILESFDRYHMDRDQLFSLLALSYDKRCNNLWLEGQKELSAKLWEKVLLTVPFFYLHTLSSISLFPLFPTLSLFCDKLLSAPPSKNQAIFSILKIDDYIPNLNSPEKEILQAKFLQVKVRHSFDECTKEFLAQLREVKNFLTKGDLESKIKEIISLNEGRCRIPLHHLNKKDLKKVLKSLAKQMVHSTFIIHKLRLEIDPDSESQFIDANSVPEDRVLFKKLSSNFMGRTCGVDLKEVRFHHLNEVIYQLIFQEAEQTTRIDSNCSLHRPGLTKPTLYLYAYPGQKQAFHLAFFETQLNDRGTAIQSFKFVQSASHTIEGLGLITERPTPEMFSRITESYRQNPNQFYLIMPGSEKSGVGGGGFSAPRTSSNFQITIGGLQGQIQGVGLNSSRKSLQKRRANPTESLEKEKKRPKIQYIPDQPPMQVDTSAHSSEEIEKVNNIVIRPEIAPLVEPTFTHLLDSIMFGFATKVVESLEKISKAKNYFDLETLIKTAQPLTDILGKPSQPPKIGQNNLKNYQNRALKTLLEADQKRQGMVLSFYPGLGKTLTSYWYLRELQRKDPAGRPCLIIVDKSMTSQWEHDLKNALMEEGVKKSGPFIHSEIVLHTSENPCQNILRCKEGSKFIITNVSCLEKYSEGLKNLPFRAVICDEAHQVALSGNSEKVSYKTVYSFFKQLKSAHPDISTLLLTGTPLVNHFSETLSLIQIANPDLNLTHFPEPWITRLELAVRRLEQNAKEGDIVDYQTQSSVSEGFLAFEYLRDLLQKYVISEFPDDERIRADWIVDGVCRLPTVVNHLVKVRLKDIQNQKIAQILSKNPITQERAEKNIIFHPQVQEEGESLAGRVKWLQGQEVDRFIEESGLLESFFGQESLYQMVVNHQKALVFVDTILFGKVLQSLIEHKFKQQGVKVQFFYGQLNELERKSMVDWYKKPQEGCAKILIVSIDSGGVGLNLQSQTVYNLSPWWTQDTQAMARAVRAGMVGEVHITRFDTLSATEQLKSKIVGLKSSMADYLFKRPSSLGESFDQFKRILLQKIDPSDHDNNLTSLLEQITEDLFENERTLKEPYKELHTNMLCARVQNLDIDNQRVQASISGSLALSPASFYPKSRYSFQQLNFGTIPLPPHINTLEEASLTTNFMLNHCSVALSNSLYKFEKMSEENWKQFWDSPQLISWFNEYFPLGTLSLTPFNREVYFPENDQITFDPTSSLRRPEITTSTVRLLQTTHNGQTRFAILLKLK